MSAPTSISVSMRVRICAGLGDGPPLSCAQLAERVGVSRKNLSAHLWLLTRDDVIFCVEGVNGGRRNYYALRPFTLADIPLDIPAGQRRCSGCQQIKPATPEYFAWRVAATQRLKSICRVCVAAAQKKFRLDNADVLEARRKARVAAKRPPPTVKPAVQREKIDKNTVRVTFADHWRPYRDGSRPNNGWTGYSSPLTRAD